VPRINTARVGIEYAVRTERVDWLARKKINTGGARDHIILLSITQRHNAEMQKVPTLLHIPKKITKPKSTGMLLFYRHATTTTRSTMRGRFPH
jgi:hypothetical protein